MLLPILQTDQFYVPSEDCLSNNWVKKGPRILRKSIQIEKVGNEWPSLFISGYCTCQRKIEGNVAKWSKKWKDHTDMMFKNLQVKVMNKIRFLSYWAETSLIRQICMTSWFGKQQFTTRGNRNEETKHSVSSNNSGVFFQQLYRIITLERWEDMEVEAICAL